PRAYPSTPPTSPGGPATTGAAIRLRSARPRSHLLWPRPALVSGSTSISKGDGPTVFAHACKMGLEGIVSKRKDSRYRSGRPPDWLKMKNPACAAVTREAEEDWS